ncbi:hypothetical protein LXL04_031111 [Taraxacum kok-saghyz]
MEGLHVAMEDAVAMYVLCGITMRCKISLSDCDENNGPNIIWFLKCFYMIFCLRINLINSNLYGVGVDLSSVQDLVAFTGCMEASFPFLYSELPVRENIGRIKST